MRTSTREVFAQPDGRLKASLSTVPQRVQRDGKWLPINTELAAADGRVEPKATGLGLAFSGGGESEPLVRLSKDGKSFALTWPGKLPAPSVDGSTAKYADVLPGVDLRMTARNDGYEQLVVVKTREAAQHVKNIRFGLKTDGLELKPGVNGSFAMVDTAGTKVFEVPSSLMWDSKERGYTEAPRTDRELVGVEIAADALTLVPHQGLLNDPATRCTRCTSTRRRTRAATTAGRRCTTTAGRAQNTIFQAGGQEKWRTTNAYGGDRVDVTPPRGATPTTTITMLAVSAPNCGSTREQRPAAITM